MPVCCRGSRRTAEPIERRMRGGPPVVVANESKSKGRQQPSVLSTQIGRKVDSVAHVCALLLSFAPFCLASFSSLRPPALPCVSAPRTISFSPFSPVERAPLTRSRDGLFAQRGVRIFRSSKRFEQERSEFQLRSRLLQNKCRFTSRIHQMKLNIYNLFLISS